MKPSLPRVLIWDNKPEASSALIEAIKPLCQDLRLVSSVGDFHKGLHSSPGFDLAIADVVSLLGLAGDEMERIRPPRSCVPLIAATDLRPEDYISEARQLRLYSVLVKTPPFDRHELSIILNSAIEPARGFGLVLHFDHTLEMYSVTASTRQEKNEAVERVINYFATNGFEIHELYDVRLILEELVNNAFYHAFRNPDGTEKYDLSTFASLDPGETVRIDFGNAGDVVGFSVTDNAGTLDPDVVLLKMERQYKKHGLFDESGRGLYISRMLATTLFFNIHPGRRTQVVAIFRERDRKHRLKPLIINFDGTGAPQPTGDALPDPPAVSMPPLPSPPPDAFSTPDDLQEDMD